MLSPVQQSQYQLESLPGDADVKKVILEDMAGNDYPTACAIASATTTQTSLQVLKSQFPGNDQCKEIGLHTHINVNVPFDARFTGMCLKKIVAAKLGVEPTSLKLVRGYQRIDTTGSLYREGMTTLDGLDNIQVVKLNQGENQVEGAGVKVPEIQPESDSCIHQ